VSKRGLKRIFDLSSILICGLENSGAESLPSKKPDETIVSKVEDILKHENEDNVRALTPILYLCCAILKLDSSWSQDINIVVKSKGLPVGAGLGSSAALSVALSATLLDSKNMLEKSNAAFPVHPENWLPTKPSLDLINYWSFIAETILHGNPSGLDNSVSTFGGAQQYTKMPSGNATMSPIESFPSLPVLIANTKVPRSTSKLVAHVRHQFEAFPSVVRRFLVWFSISYLQPESGFYFIRVFPLVFLMP
jgi:mevalonate kinase